MADLLGVVLLHKRLRDNPAWDRMDYGYCWVDMLMLANDEPRRAFANGTSYDLQRGQLLWSKQSLEKEWRKSGEWLDKFLTFCQDEGMITVDADRRRTIITILNYDAYNPPGLMQWLKAHLKAGTDTASDTGTEPVTDTEQKGEMGKEKGKVERARAENAANNFDVSGAGNTKKNAAAPGGGHPKGWTPSGVSMRPGQTVSFRGSGGKSETRDLVSYDLRGRTPAQARFEIAKELEGVSGRLDANAELGLPPDPADARREKELRAALGSLGS